MIGTSPQPALAKESGPGFPFGGVREAVLIEVKCPSCGQGYRVNDDRAGGSAKCKKCGGVIMVPRPGTSVLDTDLELPITGASRSQGTSKPPRLPTSNTIPGPATAKSSNHDLPGNISDAGAHDIAAPAPASSEEYKPRYRRRGVDPLLEGRPYDGAAEVDARRRSIVVVGIVLIAGFLMPACEPTGMGGFEISFPNIAQLGSEFLGLTEKLMLLFPLMAGIGALALAATVLPPSRGIVLLVMGLVPVLVSFADSRVMSMFDDSMIGDSISQAGVMGLLLVAGSTGIYVGSRVRWYRPSKLYSYYFGLAGAVALLLFLCLPVGGTMLIVTPFQVIKESFFGGLGMLIAVGLLLTSAVLSLVNTPNQNPSGASRIASIAFRCLLGSWVIVPSTLILALVGQGLQMGAPMTFLLTIVLGFFKIALWIGGMLLLTPMGAVDIMLGQPITDPHACVQCGYDLRGSRDRACPECGHQNA